MGYTSDDSMVRVDFFKESGKWYATEAISMAGYFDDIDGPRKAVIRWCKMGGSRYQGMWAVILDSVPWKFDHPQMFKVEEKE